MIGRRELTGAAILTALVLALLPGSAGAAAWLDPETRADSASGLPPDVTAFGEGNAAAVWVSGDRVYAAARPRGGPWGAAEELEPAGGVFAQAPKIVALANGELVAAWVLDAGFGFPSPGVVRAARRPPGGGWSSPQTISAACCPELQDLVAGADGTVIGYWTSNDGGPETAVKPPGGAAFESPQPVPSDLSNAEPAGELAVAPDGSALIVQPCFAALQCVEAVFRPSGGVWGTPEPVAEKFRNVNAVAVAATPGNGFTAAWSQDENLGRSQNPPGEVFSRDRAAGPGGAWQLTQPILPADTDDAAGCPSAFGCLDLAAAGDGALAAVWQHGPADPKIAASLRPAGGSWGAIEAVDVAGAGNAFPQGAFTGGGRLVAAWVAGGASARAAHRAPGGGWAVRELGAGRPVTLQDVVADAEGNAVTGFADAGGVRTAGFDGAPPRFTSLSFPSGQMGALPFSATAEDSWSGVSAIAWEFGDGGSATGGSVSHLYAPGTFTATATARDGAGNTASRSGPVTVTAAQGCGPSDRDRDGINDLCDATDGSKPPIPLKTVAARVIAGDVFIKLPAGAQLSQAAPVPRGFQRLDGAATIPVGSTLDTRRGRVELRASADTRRRSRTMRGQFSEGTFRLRQVRKPRGRARRRPTGLITELALTGSSFRSCGASASQRSRRRVRRLFGDGKGTFRTRGRNAAATVRGTRWTVEDRCDGTLIRVRQGRVEVRDFVRGASFILRATRSYLARRRR